MKFYIYGEKCVIPGYLVRESSSAEMESRVLRSVSLLLLLVCTSSTSDVFHDFINGLANGSEIAVVVDLSDGNLEKVKESWSMFDGNNDGEVTFGVIDGSGYETTTNLESLKEIIPRLKDLEPSVKLNASSSDLFRYLLKTMSLIAPESHVLLFTGRRTEEGPLQRACMDKLREKRTRLYVIWTGNTLEGTDAVRSLAEASNGSLVMVSDVEVSTEEEEEEETSMEPIPKLITLSKMVAPSDSEGFDKIAGEITIEDDDKTVKKLQSVRFPEAENENSQTDGPLIRNMHGTNLSMEKQQSKSALFIPVRVEVSSRSSLESMPGTQQHIEYDVKNNLHTPLTLRFTVVQPQNLRVIEIRPQWYRLQPLETGKVDVTYMSFPTATDGSEGTLTLVASAEHGGMTPLPTLIYFTSIVKRDTWDPKVTYSYLGDCKGHDKPDTCDSGEWKFEATFKDEDSGLKKVLSEPYGLNFRAPFTAGTKQPVTVFYAASCCQPKIDIWAEDGQGNYVRRSLDVNNQGLLAAEIAAVVLGVLLLICVIVGIIVTIVIVRRRKQNKLIIPRYQGST